MTSVSTPPRATRPRRVRPAGTEARRGLWAAAVTVALLCGTLFELLSPHDNLTFSWVWVHDALRAEGLLIGGPFAVAAGCHLGGREGRRGTGELFSSLPSSTLRRTALAATPAVLWPVAGYALTAAVAMTVTAVRMPPPHGAPFPTLLAADAAALGSLGLLGFLAGRLVPHLLTAPAVAGTTAVTLVAFAEDTFPFGPPEALSPLGAAAASHWIPWDVPVWWFGPASVLWFGGMGAAALLAYTARRRLAAVSLAVALAAGGVLVGTGDGLWRTDPGATALTCTDGRPQVCMARMHSPYLPHVARTLERVSAKLRSVPNTPERLVEVPLAAHGRPVPGAHVPRRNESVLEEPAVNFSFDPGYYAREAAFSAALYGCTKSPMTYGTAVPDKYSEAVSAWLTGSPDGPGTASARKVLRRMEAMPDRERTTWLGDYFAAVRDCRPERIKAP